MSNNKIEFYEQSLEEGKKKELFSDLEMYMNDDNLCYDSTNKLYNIQNKNEMISKNKETYNNMKVMHNKNEDIIKDRSIHLNDHASSIVDKDFFYNEYSPTIHNNIHNKNNEKNNSFYKCCNDKSDINKDNDVPIRSYGNIHKKNEEDDENGEDDEDEEDEKNESTANSIDKILRNIQDDILFKSNDSKTLEHCFKYNLFEEYNYPHMHQGKDENMYEHKESIYKKKPSCDKNQPPYNNEYIHDENMYKAYIWYDKKKYLYIWNKNIKVEDMRENLLTFCKKLTSENFYIVRIERISYEYNNTYPEIYEDDNLKNKNLDIYNMEQEKDSTLSREGDHTIVTLPFDDKNIMYYKKIYDNIYNYDCFDQIKNDKEYLIINNKRKVIKEKDIITEGNILKGSTLKENILKDNIFEDNILKDNILKDNTFEDNTFEDNTLEDNTFEDNILEDPLKFGEVLRAIEYTKEGCNLLKLTVFNIPHLRYFFVSKDLNFIKWYSSRKQDDQCKIYFNDINSLEVNYKNNKLFEHYKIDILKKLSFCIVYNNEKKKIILTCKSFCEYHYWITTIRALMFRSRKLKISRSILFSHLDDSFLKLAQDDILNKRDNDTIIDEINIYDRKHSEQHINPIFNNKSCDIIINQENERYNNTSSCYYKNKDKQNNFYVTYEKKNGKGLVCNKLNNDDPNMIQLKSFHLYKLISFPDYNIYQIKTKFYLLKEKFYKYKIFIEQALDDFIIKTEREHTNKYTSTDITQGDHELVGRNIRNGEYTIIYSNNKQEKRNEDMKVNVHHPVHHPVKDNVKDNMNDNVKDNMNDNVKDNMKYNMNDNVKYNVKDNMNDNVKYNMNDNVKDNRNDNVKYNMNDNVKYNMKDHFDTNKNICEEVHLSNYDYYDKSNILHCSKLKGKKKRYINKNNIHCLNEDNIFNIYEDIYTPDHNGEDTDNFKLFLIIKIFNNISNKFKDIQKNIFHVVQLMDMEKLDENKNQKTNLFSFDNLLKYSTDIYKMLQQTFGQNEKRQIIGEEKHVDILDNIQGQEIKQMHNMKKLTKMKNINNNNNNNNNNKIYCDNNNNIYCDNNNNNNIYCDNLTSDHNTKKDIPYYSQHKHIHTNEHNYFLLSKEKKQEFGKKKKKLIHHILFQLWMCEVDLGNIDDIYTVYMNNIKNKNNNININNFLINLDTSKIFNSISSQLSATILKYINL
ncbi:hypothetical protein PRSY57_1019000 [Plasmodium reichenowi]|uniref:PH domain-containing protein n=1 Tax=Plasmodium reichenowi TaxID=5854 RepID=A0A151LFD7_PLARE|nr:hypothetical protein PRSY57_1019000 [Plasmodium reichenowi]KYN97652.1 hypothetical protein PRSY57_1019000 [Plasmodium reichenowi]